MPRRDKLIVITVLVLMVAAWTLHSLLHPRIPGGDLNFVNTMVAKDMDPSLYVRDYVFANSTLYQLYTPSFRWLQAQLWRMAGSFEMGLVWLTPIVLSIYLAGMYILFWRVTANTWLALGLTAASASYYLSIGEEIWGVGGSSHMLVRTIFTALVPYLMMGLLATLKSPTLANGAILGLALGLAANVHPTSGLHLAMLAGGLLFIWYGWRGQWQLWGMLGLVVVMIMAGAWPIIQHVVDNSGRALPPEVSFTEFSQVAEARFPIPFNPATLEWRLLNVEFHQPVLVFLVWFYLGLVIVVLLTAMWLWSRWPGLIRWTWLVGGLVTVWYAYLVADFNLTFFFGLIGLYVVYRFWQRSIIPLDGWMMILAGLVILASFVGYYLLYQIWKTFEAWSLTSLFFEQIRSARFIYLPVFILTGRAGLVLIERLEPYLELASQRFKLANLPDNNRPYLSISVGLMISLGPKLSETFFTQMFSLVLALLGILSGVVLVTLLLKALARTPLVRWRAVVGVLSIALVLFGPPGPLLAPYLPVPAINLLNAEARAPEPLVLPEDAELYEWTLKKTPRDALFFWCGFGPSTTLYFRVKAQRSLTHNWKDLNLGMYDRASLVPAYQRYLRLEQACAEIGSAIAAAREQEADFILAPADRAAELMVESCFSNHRYVVFPVTPNVCPK